MSGGGNSRRARGCHHGRLGPEAWLSSNEESPAYKNAGNAPIVWFPLVMLTEPVSALHV